jgi:hypothetical protein
MERSGGFYPGSHPGEYQRHDRCASGNVIFHCATDPIRLVQEELSVTERRFGILINKPPSPLCSA